VRWVLPVLALASAAVTPPSEAARRPRHGGKARVPAATSKDAKTAPWELWPRSAIALVAQAGDTLYRIDEGGGVVPHLAEAPPVLSSDGLEARIRVRPRVRCALGGLQRPGRSPHAWLLSSVTEVREDGGAVVISLRRPTPDLARRLSAPPTALRCGPLSARGFKALESHWQGKPYIEALVPVVAPSARERALLFELGKLDWTPAAAGSGMVLGPVVNGLNLIAREEAVVRAVRSTVDPARLTRFVPGHALPDGEPDGRPATRALDGRGLRLVVRDTSHLRAIAESIALALEATGATVRVDARDTKGLVQALEGREGDLVLYERPPIVSDPKLIEEQIKALAGGATTIRLLRYRSAWDHQPGWHGLTFDPAGFPRFEGVWHEQGGK